MLELSAWRRLSPANEQLFQDAINPDKVREGMKEYYVASDNIFEKIKQQYPGFSNVKLSDPGFSEEGLSEMDLKDEDLELDFSEDLVEETGFSKAEYWEIKLTDPWFIDDMLDGQERFIRTKGK